jgi:hypothetical protein
MKTIKSGVAPGTDVLCLKLTPGIHANGFGCTEEVHSGSRQSQKALSLGWRSVSVRSQGSPRTGVNFFVWLLLQKLPLDC